MLLLAAAPPALRAQAPAIEVEGETGDWAGLGTTAIDPSNDAPSGGVDFGRLWASADNATLHLLLEVGRETILQNPASGPAGNAIRVFVDADANSATGLPVAGMGADLVLELGGRAATWHRATGGPLALSPNEVGLRSGPTHSATTFELAIPFAIRPDLGTPVTLISGSTVRLRVDEEGGDVLPDAGFVTFSWTRTPPPAVAATGLARLSPRDVRLLVQNVERDTPLADPDPFRRVLAAVRPDIIAWQEVYDMPTEDAIAFVEGALGEPGAWTAARRNDCITLSRHPILAAASINGNLAALIDLPDAAFPGDLVLFNAHTPCCDNNAGRDAEHDALSSTWRRLIDGTGPFPIAAGTAAVMTGDFNMVGYQRQLRTLRDGDIIDEATYGPDFAPARAAGPMTALPLRHTHTRERYTWNNPFGSFVAGRLDWIFVTGDVLEARRHYILNTAALPADVLAATGLRASDSAAADHLPLVADFAPATSAGLLLR